MATTGLRGLRPKVGRPRTNPFRSRSTKRCLECGALRNIEEFAPFPRRSVTRRDACRRCVRTATSRALWTDAGYRQHTMAQQRIKTNVWTHAEEQIIRTYIGHERTAVVAERCTAASGNKRSAAAVQFKAYQLGESTWRKGLAVREVSRLFGVSDRAVLGWRRQGQLAGQPWGERLIVSTDADLRTFITGYPWLYDPKRMQVGPLRALAEVCWRRHPWFTVAEAAKLAGVSATSIHKCARLGTVPVQRRVGAHGGALMFDVDGIVALRELPKTWTPRIVRITRAAAESRAKRKLQVAA